MSSMLAVWPFFYSFSFLLRLSSVSRTVSFFLAVAFFLLLYSHERRKERGPRLICTKSLINSVALIPKTDRNANIIIYDHSCSQWNGTKGKYRQIDKNVSECKRSTESSFSFAYHHNPFEI